MQREKQAKIVIVAGKKIESKRDNVARKIEGGRIQRFKLQTWK